MLHGIGSDPAVAVPARAADGQELPELHLVDGRRLGVQAVGPGRGGAPVGHPQEQAQDELREAEPRPALLLRQEHHPQDGRQEIRLPLRLRSSKSLGVSPPFIRSSLSLRLRFVIRLDQSVPHHSFVSA